MPRLHAIAEAAQRGELSVERLTGMSPEEAREAVQQLPGIGPFYSALIVVRACGLADVLTDVSHVREAVDRFWGRSFDDAEFAELAEGWRPFRTWVAVMLRAVGEEAEPVGTLGECRRETRSGGPASDCTRCWPGRS